MTLKEASKKYHISIEKLKFYEEKRLLVCHQYVDGVPNYTEGELLRVGIIQSLLKSGFDTDMLKRFFSLLDDSSRNKKELIQMLRKQRYILLDEIHDKQQALDELDYLIEKIRKE